MAKIYDYNLFSSKGYSRDEYSFNFELKYLDIDIHNKPEEYQDITDADAFIEYSIDLQFKKTGIESIFFRVNSIELNLKVDDYPEPAMEYDIDLIPGKTIDSDQIEEKTLYNLIPSYPNKLEIDMNKSADPKKFKIKVYFGND